MSERALRRLVMKLTKENLWIYIVRLLMERPMYGYEVAKAVRDRFGIRMSNVGVYVVLYKMERDGLIESYMDGDSRVYRLREPTVELWIKARDFMGKVLSDVFGCGVHCGAG